jgi:hypothetical protein
MLLLVLLLALLLELLLVLLHLHLLLMLLSVAFMSAQMQHSKRPRGCDGAPDEEVSSYNFRQGHCARRCGYPGRFYASCGGSFHS